MSYRPRVAFATTRTHSIHGVEIDYDGEDLSFTEARDRLTHYGIECVLYTSASHTPEKARWRILCPTEEAITAAVRTRRRTRAACDGRRPRSPCRCSATRTTSASTGRTASSAGDGHPRRRARRRPARRAARSRQPGERRLGGYRLPFAGQPGDPRKTAGCFRSSSWRSPGASRCRRTSDAATPPGRRSAPRWSTCSPPRNAASSW